MTAGLRSGELADAAGVNLQTLRYYERRGLLAEPRRSPGGHRLYPIEALTTLRVIKTAQRLGFTLDEVALLNIGAARVPAKFQGRALTLDARRAAAAAAVVGASIVLPAHYDGWAHFSEGLDDVERAFDDAGLSSLLKVAPHGTWVGWR